MDLNVEPTPFLWVEESNGQIYTPRTRKRKKKKKEYLGWGSKQLITFLKSIGKQTDQPMSQHDITKTINQYINEGRLLHPEKKKKVMCDGMLHALFGRKSVNWNKIHDLLEEHLAENQVGSDDDPFYSSEEKEDFSALNKKQKVSSSERKTLPKNKVIEVSKNCLAAISPANIKLVYLKRTLVQDLLRESETFENKVLGSYVRVKSDPLDIFQKNSHVIQVVTGIKSAAAGDNLSRTLLQISDMTDITISSLSDDDFTTEECDDLHQRVKDGLLKQPTVGELEQKVELLHEDITKHWLERELVLLRNLIDRANEKGWRHKVTEYLDRRKLLQTPSEQSRLLSEIPEVVPEEVKSEKVVEDSPDAVNQEVESPKGLDWDWEPCYDSSTKGVMIDFSSMPKNQGEKVGIAERMDRHDQSFRLEVEQGEKVGISERINYHDKPFRMEEQGEKVGIAKKISCHDHSIRMEVEQGEKLGMAKRINSHDQVFQMEVEQGEKIGIAKRINCYNESIQMEVEQAFPETDAKRAEVNGHFVSLEPKEGNLIREGATAAKIDVHANPRDIPIEEAMATGINVHTKPKDIRKDEAKATEVDVHSRRSVTQASYDHARTPSLQTRDTHGTEDALKKPVEVIDLSDDDEEEEAQHGGQGKMGNILDVLMWHYVDPQGNVQGPFSLNSLKRWKDAKYFKDTFRVWQAGQSQQESALLTDILRRFFRI